MEKLKDIVLIVFAVVGFISTLSGFTEQQVTGTPESHVWEVYGTEAGLGYSYSWLLNKQTGEVKGLNAERNAVVTLQTLDKSK